MRDFGLIAVVVRLRIGLVVKIWLCCSLNVSPAVSQHFLTTSGVHSNSAVAINTLVCSITSAVTSLSASALYDRPGFASATSLLGSPCMTSMPVLVLLYKHGAGMDSDQDCTDRVKLGNEILAQG